ncbi:hypothetical protein BT69DRAFT_1333963 [Atractiella rhizophila]|nr:hypothetical protein BT69DRAFT_1333963 [Atractiella rhizophila]
MSVSDFSGYRGSLKVEGNEAADSLAHEAAKREDVPLPSAFPFSPSSFAQAIRSHSLPQSGTLTNGSKHHPKAKGDLSSAKTYSMLAALRDYLHHRKVRESPSYQLHSLDDCQYQDENETYAKKLLKQLASNALQQDFKEWPVAKFDKIFKGWSFYCEESDMLSAEDFVNHMQAEQGNVILQEKPRRSRKK